MKRSAHTAGGAFAVERVGGFEHLAVHRDDRVQPRALEIVGANARQIGRATSERDVTAPDGQRRLQLVDRLLPHVERGRLTLRRAAGAPPSMTIGGSGRA